MEVANEEAGQRSVSEPCEEDKGQHSNCPVSCFLAKLNLSKYTEKLVKELGYDDLQLIIEMPQEEFEELMSDAEMLNPSLYEGSFLLQLKSSWC